MIATMGVAALTLFTASVFVLSLTAKDREIRLMARMAALLLFTLLGFVGFAALGGMVPQNSLWFGIVLGLGACLSATGVTGCIMVVMRLPLKHAVAFVVALSLVAAILMIAW